MRRQRSLITQWGLLWSYSIPLSYMQCPLLQIPMHNIMVQWKLQSQTPQTLCMLEFSQRFLGENPSRKSNKTQGRTTISFKTFANIVRLQMSVFFFFWGLRPQKGPNERQTNFARQQLQICQAEVYVNRLRVESSLLMTRIKWPQKLINKEYYFYAKNVYIISKPTPMCVHSSQLFEQTTTLLTMRSCQFKG